MEFAELIKTTRVDNVILRRQSSSLVEGTLCLTSHHLIFSSRVSEKDELMLLYMAIEDVQKKIAGYNGTINIICKDFTSFKLRIPGAENCLNVAASIEALSTLENQTWYYPFFHRLDFIITENGWDAFSPEVELKNLIDGSDSWRICSLNNEFKASSSVFSSHIVCGDVADEIEETKVNGIGYCSEQQGFHDVLSFHTKKPGESRMEFAELIKTTRVDNVILRRQSSSLVEGTLCLTSHHLIFSSRVSEKDELMLLYMAIEDVQKKIAGYNGTINIICKDFTSFKLRIPGAENCLNVAASIEALSTLGKCNTL
eukprot:gene8507-14507_t